MGSFETFIYFDLSMCSMVCSMHSHFAHLAQTAAATPYGGSSPSYQIPVRFGTHQGRVYGYGYSVAHLSDAYDFSVPERRETYALSSAVPVDYVAASRDFSLTGFQPAAPALAPVDVRVTLSPSFSTSGSSYQDTVAAQDLLARIAAERTTLGGLEQHSLADHDVAF